MDFYYKFTSSSIGQFIANLSMIISGPGVILGGIWLLVLQEWSLVGYGILWIILSSYIIAIILLPGMLIDGIALSMKYPILKYIFVFLSNVYTNFIMLMISLFAFAVFGAYHSITDMSNLQSLPYYLWLWGIAIGPWQSILSSDNNMNSYFFNSYHRFRKDLETINVLGLIILYFGFIVMCLFFGLDSVPFALYFLCWCLAQLLVIPSLLTYLLYSEDR